MSIIGSSGTVANWYRFAGEDLAAARELAGRGLYHHQVCLLCRQSAETYLKAALLSRGWKLVETTVLPPLVRECFCYDNAFEPLFSAGELLNKYIVTDEYPGELPFENTTGEDARRALEAASKVEEIVLANPV